MLYLKKETSFNSREILLIALIFILLAVDETDLVRGHVTEKVVIPPPDLTITDGHPQCPTGLDGHPHSTDPRELRIASTSEDVVYLREVAGTKVIARVRLEIKGVMAWDESQCVGGVDTPRLLITGVDP